MKNKVSIKLGFVIVIAALLFVSLFNPITIGYNTDIKTTMLNEKQNMHNSSFDRYTLLDPYYPEINIPEQYKTETSGSLKLVKQKEKPTLTEVLNNDPLDSPWPMYCHDVRHTGRSPYSTAGNTGIEKWRFDTNDDPVTGSPVIDEEGIIYISASDLFAVYPNGTEKWSKKIEGKIKSAPAIDENGVLYVGSIWGYPTDYIYAINKSKGRLIWRYKTDNIFSSPAIGNDGTIYFGDTENWKIKALYPNGTYKWDYKTDFVIYSSPAIGPDGTIYCGSHDTYLYALYPNNGTLKWKYKTGHWIRTAPCIGDDGMIYVVSLDDHLHAVNPDGTRKWKTNVGAGTSPTIGQDGTIYCGYDRLHAVNPDNGSIRWSFNPGERRQIRGATPCNSADGIIFFGTHIGDTDGGELIAVNPDGTERWRIMVATTWADTAPAIGKDGTIYIGSWDRGPPHGWGWLHAINELDPDAPSAPEIKGPKIVFPGIEYKYKFKSTSPIGRDIYFWVQWDEYTDTRWSGPHKSGETVTLTYQWMYPGKFSVRAVAKDTENLWSQWTIHNPRSKTISKTFSFNMVEHFPSLKLLFPLYSS